MTLLAQLLIAHFTADFLLQPKGLLEQKQQRPWTSGWLYVHGAIHFALAWLLSWDLTFWWSALAIGLSHILIDGLHQSLKNERRNRWLLLLDQGLHIAVLVILAGIWSKTPLLPANFDADRFWRVTCGALFLTLPVAHMIRGLLTPWTKEMDDAEPLAALPRAGQYIGMLERLIAYGFLLMGMWQAVGFLLAAKSVFRFNDLTRAKDRRLTEYVMVGTLLSFGIAYAVALMVGPLPPPK